MNKKYIKLLSILLPILLGIICIALVIKNNNQAGMPVPKEIAFVGEYSYDGVSWFPYEEGADISALEGDIILRGHLDSDTIEGALLNFYCNHIGVSIFVNGELQYIDTLAEIRNYGINLMSSMCGKRWEHMLCPTITTEDEIEFRFINYHHHGNQNAYKEAMSSLLITPQDNTILEVYLKPYIEPFELTGYAVLIVAVMLLGASLSAVVFRSNMAGELFKLGITTLFVAGYMVFDVMMVFLMDELLAVKTHGSQLCLMLAIYFMGIMICDALKDKNNKIAKAIMGVSGIVNILIMVLSIVGKVLLYDTLYYWKLLQYIVSAALMILCVLEIKREKRYRIDLLAYIGINIAVILDMAGAGEGMFYSGIWFKTVFLLVLVVFLFYGAKQVVMDHQASIKNKKLKEELEKSRISVMLSQIQPHFLYNSLTSVMDLCDRNPKQAKAAVADFADYLRGNLSALKTENLISFGAELEHIKKYLRLEKLRFQNELEIKYDIQTQDFMLPALSVQPLVENAVKHGVGRKIGGGTVTIHTSEADEFYLIRISDDGVGFSEGEYADQEGSHVGIENTKKRLEMMQHARLEIESKKGEGTRASILIPKRRD